MKIDIIIAVSIGQTLQRESYWRDYFDIDLIQEERYVEQRSGRGLIPLDCLKIAVIIADSTGLKLQRESYWRDYFDADRS